MKSQQILLMSLFILLLVTNCNTGKQSVELPTVSEIDQRFISHISGFSGGLLSKKSDIVIELSEAYHEMKAMGESLPNDLFTFEPKIDGTIIWDNPYTLRFVPTSELPSGTVYVAQFDLGKIKAVEDELKQFQFYFKTKDLVIQLVYDQFNNIGDDYVEIQGSVIATDVIDTAALFNAVKMNYKGATIGLKWSVGKGNVHRFVSDRVLRNDAETKMQLSGDKAFFGSSIQHDIVVPAKGEFKLIRATTSTKGAQHALLVFSEELDPMQDIEGLVMLDDRDAMDITFDGNRMKIFPNEQLTGRVTLKLFKGIKSNAGFSLQANQTTELHFNELPPSLEVLGQGTIVPTTDGAHFPFRAVNLKAIDVFVTKIHAGNILQFLQENQLSGDRGIKRVGKDIWRQTIFLDDTRNLREWNNFAVDISQFIQEDPTAMYRITLSFAKEHAIYACDNPAEDITLLANEKSGWSEQDWQVNSWYDDYYYDYEYDDIEDWRNPCGNRFYRNKATSKNVVVSDIAAVAKAGQDEQLYLFVSNLKTTLPIASASVELYSFQQELLATGTTDELGTLVIRSNDKPFVAVVKHNGQSTYLRLRDSDSKSISKFDVSGQYVAQGVKGFIYTERDVRRPGDSIYVSFMLEDSRDVLPATHPVKFTLKNPQGVTVNQQIKRISLNDLYNFRAVTDNKAITGNYIAQVELGNNVFSKVIKVETVKPNRLKVELTAAGKMLRYGQSDELQLFSQWLHGASAGGLKGVVEMRLTGGYTQFKGYEGYQFDDPLKRFYSKESVAFEGNLDNTGKVSFSPEINVQSSAPGMLQATFTTKVFEGGGDFSIDRRMFNYSPFKHYVGLQLPEGDLWGGTLLTDKPHTFDVVLLTDEGKLKSGNVNVTIYRIDNNWWWDSYNRNISSYINRSSTVPISNEQLTLTSGKGSISFKADKADWGRYYVKITHEDGHTTGKLFSVDWPYWARTNRKADENAAMLGFSTDKEKYAIGEEVKVTIPSPKVGRAIVTIENGTAILENFWITTTEGETQLAFKTTAEMAPNVYVHVTLSQPHAVTGNDLPIRMYGVVPIQVEDTNTHITPVIAMKEELSPETTAEINVSNSEKKPMTYTLAVVDEGLLDLTNFKTPQPWNHFYSKEALGVRTWDVYDDVLGAYGARIDQLLAVGGDAEINTKANPSANRFKPMVRFMGPYYYDGTTENKHEVDIPNYVGSVRVMVVAKGQEEDYGSAEKAVPVRSSVMVLATLPRVLGPGETVTLPVNVFNMDEKGKIVTVKVKTNDMLEVIGDKELKARFLAKGDKIINFKVRVKDHIGIGEVKVSAGDESYTARDEIELDVRPSNPAMTWTEQFVLEPGNSLDHELILKGIKGTNEASIEISSIPSLNLEERLGYLMAYPHGCLEQTVSAAFPQLYLAKIMDVDQDERKRMQQNVVAALDRIQLHMTGSGSFSYWPGGTRVNEWASIYTGHFIAETEKSGYTVPYYTKRRWINDQRNMAKNWSSSETQNSSAYNDLTQAYRLYVLALMNEEDLGAMNRLREKNNLTTQAKWRLAGAYALAGRKDVALTLVNPKAPVQFSKSVNHTFGSSTRDDAMVLEILTLLGEDKEGMKLAMKIAKEVSGTRWMSTQTIAFSLMAVSKFINADTSASSIMEYAYQFDNGTELTKRTARSVVQHPLKGKNQRLNIVNNGNQKIFVRIAHTGIPMPGTQPSMSEVLSMDIRYYNSHTKAPLDPFKIEQGTDFTVEFTVKNNGDRGNLSELALNQIFPSGWEVHNSRMDGYSAGAGIDYQDIRDDRIYSYFNLNAGKSIQLKVKLNAAYLGKFYLPGILAEAMYDGDIKAFQSGGWVEVVPQPKVEND